MRAAANTTLVRGRHRLGRAGSVPVTFFVAVVRRNFLVSMFRRGRHRADRVRHSPAAALQPSPAAV